MTTTHSHEQLPREEAPSVPEKSSRIEAIMRDVEDRKKEILQWPASLSEYFFTVA
jgi:hypothetical protein